MANPNSQEQTIYRSLAGQIQMGFYDDGARFPSAQEVAGRYQVSYCPAQRALKALERDGLVKLSRGKETVVLKRPYGDYLASPVFRRRAEAMADLTRSLALISPAVCHQGLRRLAPGELDRWEGCAPGKQIYRMFDQSLQALGSHTVLSLYYDVGAFVGSAYLDILRAQEGVEAADRILASAAGDLRRGALEPEAGGRLAELAGPFFQPVLDYLDGLPDLGEGEPFVWEPRKGRTRYCDAVAVDLVCRIHQGEYPVGKLLPRGEILADIYHVSAITMRRTMSLLVRLGVAETVNGVGTRVVFQGDGAMPYKLKELGLDGNLRTCLEALQLLAITAEPVLRHTFPHMSPQAREEIAAAAGVERNAGMVAAIGAGLQAVVRYCPLAAIREIYSKLTLLLLKGGLLRMGETGEELVEGWPEVARTLRDSMEAGDAGRFAAAFRLQCGRNFESIRRALLEIGSAGTEEVAVPWTEGKDE